MNDRLRTMSELYHKLSNLGLSKRFIRAIGLPSWWVDELDYSENLSVVYEAAGHISSRLLIDLKSLINHNQRVKFISNMTYEEVLDILRGRKQCLRELRDLGTDILSNDVNDYFEQLLEVEL